MTWFISSFESQVLQLIVAFTEYLKFNENSTFQVHITFVFLLEILCKLSKSPEIWTGQNRSPIFWYVVLIIFEGWPNRTRPSKPICPKGWDGRALLVQPSKGKPCRILILFLYIISTTYQKIGDLFWVNLPCYISGLSHSVRSTRYICLFIRNSL